MKLTGLILVILPYTVFAVDTRFPDIKKKLHHHPLNVAFNPPKANYNPAHLPVEGASEPIVDPRYKRDNTPSSSLIIDFLPPPWSPSSHLDSPYPLTGISPTSDSGRSEVLDNEPSAQATWRKCPTDNLDCTKCPRDTRCRRSGIPWWQIDPTIADAVGGAPVVCPLTTCNAAGTGKTSCGKNARCVRDHCVCETGFKGTMGSLRGFKDLQAVTVWVSGGVDCSVRCDNLSCAEVDQVSACFEKGEKPAGVDDIETAKTGASAMKAPGPGGAASRVRRGVNYCDV